MAPSTSLRPSGSPGPTALETPAPTAEPVLRIRVADYYLAYVSPNAREPTTDEYELMVNLTQNYFQDYFEDLYADRDDVEFLGAESNLEFTLFEEGIPAEKFNIYMDYAYTDLIYTVGSNPPDASESFIIMRDSITVEYILDYVRAATGTPFTAVNEVVFRASTMDAPIRSGQQRSGEKEESTASSPLMAMAATAAAALVILGAGAAVYRQRRKQQRDFVDGIYAAEGKVLEGYFSENSVTEISDNNSRFPLPTLSRVPEEPPESEEEEKIEEGDEKQPLRGL